GSSEPPRRLRSIAPTYPPYRGTQTLRPLVCTPRILGLCPVCPADMLSAVQVSTSCEPAGRADCKSMFRTAPHFNSLRQGFQSPEKMPVSASIDRAKLDENAIITKTQGRT